LERTAFPLGACAADEVAFATEAGLQPPLRPGFATVSSEPSRMAMTAGFGTNNL
jgi:hypothetical protein